MNKNSNFPDNFKARLQLPLVFRSDDIKYFDFPQIGISKSIVYNSNVSDETVFLQKLNFDFLHIDIKLYNKGWENHINTSLSDSLLLNCPLFITLFVDDNSLKNIQEFINLISGKNIKYLNLCFHNSEILNKQENYQISGLTQISDKLDIGCEVKTLFAESIDNQVFNNYFKFINYTFSLRLSDYKYLHFSPKLPHQVKTVDLLHNLNKNLHLRLKLAFVNSNNIVKANILSDNQISLADHEKQSLIYTAGWVIRYLQTFISKGVNHFTFFELCGNKGILENACKEANNIHENTFVFLPLYHVIHAIMEFKNGKILPLETINPDINAILLTNDGEKRILITNLSGSVRDLSIENTPKFISIRRLDYTTIEKSIYCPLWIIGKPEFVETENNHHPININPFSIFLVDLLEHF